MRVWTVPAVIVGVLVTSGSGEPSEAAMRAAFAATLADDVQSALAFVAETGGETALARVRAARTDAFDIRAFIKLGCMPTAAKTGHVCDFAVRLGVVNGELARTVTGRFYAGPHGLVFEAADMGPAGA
ncbi:MAG TPA: hypothetical protein VLX44_11735 [Xanthobacteraceae bacterium]|nr:hypothetical protein [Xanthobacteraceae bacterium]